jgi:hypothetical protein
MAAAGKPMDTTDVISYILAGLDDEYDGFVAAINALLKAKKFISLSDVYSQFMTYEARLVARSSGDGASANLANRSGRGRGRGQYQEQQHQYRDQRSDYNQRNYERSYDQRSNRDGYGGGYGGGRGNGGRNQRGGRSNAGHSNDICQVCGKEGHIALNCWKRFRKGYMGPDKSAGAAVRAKFKPQVLCV